MFKVSVLLFSLFFSSCPVLLGQKPLEVKGHVIGESAEEFFTKAGFPVAQCQSIGENKKEAKREKIDLNVCESIEAARTGRRIITTDPAWNTQSTEKNKTIARILASIPPRNQAVIDGAKLVMIDMRMSDFAAVEPLLEEKYGKPSKRFTEAFQNGYGAKFDVGRAAWIMADGSVITAFETVNFGQELGYYRTTDVTFATAEEAQKQINQASGSSKNPFDR